MRPKATCETELQLQHNAQTTALPPAFRMDKPISDASGCEEATAPETQSTGDLRGQVVCVGSRENDQNKVQHRRETKCRSLSSNSGSTCLVSLLSVDIARNQSFSNTQCEIRIKNNQGLRTCDTQL